MAQLVEQRIRNAWVAGSSPASGSKHRTMFGKCNKEGELLQFSLLLFIDYQSNKLYCRIWDNTLSRKVYTPYMGTNFFGSQKSVTELCQKYDINFFRGVATRKLNKYHLSHTSYD